MEATGVLDLDEYLNNEEKLNKAIDKELDSAYFGRRKKKNITLNDEAEKPEARKEEKLSDIKIGTTTDALTRHARIKLETYLKQSPQYKTLDAQINLLTEELAKYKGIPELYESTHALIKSLIDQRRKFTKLFRNKNYKQERDNNIEKVKNSEVLKELKAKREALEQEYAMNNANSLVFKLKQLRDSLGINANLDYSEIIDSESDDIDEYLKTYETQTVKQEYENLCGHIADIIDASPTEVFNMSIGKIQTLLKQYCPDMKPVKEEIDRVKFLAQNEMNKVKGYEDITNIIFEIFDFNVVPEEKPKEMLAASNVAYVKSVAYNLCSRQNMMHNFDDAVAYGLLGLSIAIDKWYTIQKMEDSAMSFAGFAHQYVVGDIKKGLFELTSGGMINKSSAATVDFNRNKQMELFLTTNPELKSVPSEMLEILFDRAYTMQRPDQVVSQSKYEEIVGGGNGADIDGDIWANAVGSGDSFDDSFAESKMEYENLLKSIKALFNMFETKIDKTTGEKVKTEYKIFNKFDYKLFKLYFGLEFKRESIGQKGANATMTNRYNQTEMAQIMVDYYAQFGIKKTFTQSAINYQISRLLEKIKLIMDENPVIRAGFEFIFNYWQTNSETMNYLSNNREELGIKLDRDELRQTYKDNDAEMNRQLSDGKRLSDIFTTSDMNMLDEEIANVFKQY